MSDDRRGRVDLSALDPKKRADGIPPPPPPPPPPAPAPTADPPPEPEPEPEPVEDATPKKAPPTRSRPRRPTKPEVPPVGRPRENQWELPVGLPERAAGWVRTTSTEANRTLGEVLLDVVAEHHQAVIDEANEEATPRPGGFPAARPRRPQQGEPRSAVQFLVTVPSAVLVCDKAEEAGLPFATFVQRCFARHLDGVYPTDETASRGARSES